MEDILYSPIGRPDDPDRVIALKCGSNNYWPDFENKIGDVLEQFLFELNNQATRAKAEYVVCKLISEQDHVYDYRVVCDSNNNSPQTIADHKLIVDIWMQPKATVSMMYYRVTLG